MEAKVVPLDRRQVYPNRTRYVAWVNETSQHCRYTVHLYRYTVQLDSLTVPYSTVLQTVSVMFMCSSEFSSLSDCSTKQTMLGPCYDLTSLRSLGALGPLPNK